MEHKSEDYTNCNWCSRYSHRSITKGTGWLGNKRTSWDHFELQHYWEWPEYWEESLRLEETCCHSNSSEIPSAYTDMKNSQGENNHHHNNNLDLVRELKKLWNVRVMVIVVVVSTLRTVLKALEKSVEELEISGRIEIIQATELVRMVIILRRVLEMWGDLVSLRLQRKTICLCWCETLATSIMITIEIWKMFYTPTRINNGSLKSYYS